MPNDKIPRGRKKGYREGIWGIPNNMAVCSKTDIIDGSTKYFGND